MAILIHKLESLNQSIKLENNLVSLGMIQDVSKLGYFTKDSLYTQRHKSILDLMTKSKKNENGSEYFHPVFIDMKGLPESDNMTDLTDWDASIVNPAAIGYNFVEVDDVQHLPVDDKDYDSKKLGPIEYLERFVFPVLTPAMENMLKMAENFNCFQRKRTAFDPLDFLVEHLYKGNVQLEDKLLERQNISFSEIPFVAQHWLHYPRRPLPKSLVWTEAEATVVIQSFWRGYLVRKDPEIQELRIWQKQWRDINADVRTKVKQFWHERDEASSRLSSRHSEEVTVPQ